jgi:hypothetical protein
MQKPRVSYIVTNGSFTTIKRVVQFSKLNELDVLAINKGNEKKKAQVAQLVERNFEGV